MNLNTESECRFLTKSKCVRSLKMKPCVTWAEMTCGDLLQLCRTAVVRGTGGLDPEWQKCVDNPVVIPIRLSSHCRRCIFCHKLYFLSLHFQCIDRILSETVTPALPPSAGLRYGDFYRLNNNSFSLSVFLMLIFVLLLDYICNSKVLVWNIGDKLKR